MKGKPLDIRRTQNKIKKHEFTVVEGSEKYMPAQLISSYKGTKHCNNCLEKYRLTKMKMDA
jgi:hypothetical protein